MSEENMDGLGAEAYDKGAETGAPPQAGTETAGPSDSEGKEAGSQVEASKETAGATGKSETLLGKTPEGAKEIDFKSIVPEGMEYDEARAEAFASIAREAGLTNEQIGSMAAYGMKYAQELATAVNEAYLKRIDDWGEEAKKELGQNCDEVLTVAGKGIEALEKKIPNLRQALNETGAGNRIEIIQALKLVGELTSEDTFRGFGTASRGQTNIYTKTNFDAYK